MTGTKVYHDSTMHGHKPVEMIIQRTPEHLLGYRLDMPRPFEGVPKKDAKQWNTPEGEPYNLTGTLEQQWEVWNRTAELTVARKEDKQHLKYFGRGMEPELVKNKVAARQDGSGCAVTKEIDEIFT